MKLVTLLIPPSKLEAIKKALWELGLRSATVTSCEGLSLQKGAAEDGADFTAAALPRLRVEMMVKDSDAERLLEAAMEALRTGRVNDGKAFIVDLEQVARIRTGERGEPAL